MKKSLIIILFLSVIVSLANAQTMKPVAGNYTGEVGFAPFGNTPIQVDMLKMRYFLNDDFAIRCGLHFDMLNEKEEPYNSTPNGKDSDKKSYMELGFIPGFEMHMGKFERFDPYCGGELAFNIKSSKQTYVDNANNITRETKGAWNDGSERAYFGILVNLFTGFEYYFTPHVYLGTEMGFGMMNMTYKEATTTITGQSDFKRSKSSFTNVGVNGTGNIHLGWVF